MHIVALTVWSYRQEFPTDPHFTFLLSREQVFYTPGLEDSGGRSIGISTRNDGPKVNVVFECALSAAADLGTRVTNALENIPIVEDGEEIRTSRFKGLLTVQEQSLSALVYECP